MNTMYLQVLIVRQKMLQNINLTDKTRHLQNKEI